MCLILTVHLPSTKTTAVFMFEFNVGTTLGLVALSFGFPDVNAEFVAYIQV